MIGYDTDTGRVGSSGSRWFPFGPALTFGTDFAAGRWLGTGADFGAVFPGCDAGNSHGLDDLGVAGTGLFLGSSLGATATGAV